MVDEKESKEERKKESEAAPAESGGRMAADEKDEKEIPTPEPEPFLRHFSSSLRLLIAGVLIYAVLYPAVLLLAGKVFWGDKSEGSMVHIDGKIIGAELIGQSFVSEKFFHPRPSSKGYDGRNSGSQNLGPYNEALTERVTARLGELQEQGIAPDGIPVGWVTESGSALDPHITPAAALLQVRRVSRAAGLPREDLERMIDKHTERKTMWIFGQERVNVLMLNLDVQKRMEGSE
ncbi:MAG: K(+)-transporting ATPase subunit C [Candidatus Krumholzibacteriales bacterium]